MFVIGDDLSPDNRGGPVVAKNSLNDPFYDFCAESPARDVPKKQALRVSDASTAAPDGPAPARSSEPSLASPSHLFCLKSILNRSFDYRSYPNKFQFWKVWHFNFGKWACRGPSFEQARILK